MKKVIVILLVLAAFSGGAVVRPYATGTQVWSIAAYTGDSPFDLKPEWVPGLHISEIKDIDVRFVADPFISKVPGNPFWYLFFEIMPKKGNSVIGWATSVDGIHWVYLGVCLKEDFPLSYPFVFNYYGYPHMVPESARAGEIRLYSAVRGGKWKFEKVLVKGSYTDPTIFEHNGMWWMFAGKDCDHLHLFFADDLFGEWNEHPMSPVVRDNPNIARPGGRPIVYDGKLIRFAQDDYPKYGNAVRAFEITRLSTTEYEEHEIGTVLEGSGSGWNSHGMHTLDAHKNGDRWIAAVDGWTMVRFRDRVKRFFTGD